MTEQTRSPARKPARSGRSGDRGIPAALTRYRVMAYIVGTMLLLLVFVAMPIKYFGHNDTPVAVVGTAHGFLYCVYLLTAFDLALRARWRAVGTLLVLLAGTIPFLSFVAERKVTRKTRAGERL
jgi:integral membrane protein